MKLFGKREVLPQPPEELRVEQVFTPSTYATVTYVERDTPQVELVYALRTPGEQVVLFGPSGVGKSTLLVHTLAHPEVNQGAITTKCLGRMSFDEVLLDAFDQLAPFYSSVESSGNESSIGGRAGVKYAEIHGEIVQRTTRDAERILPPQLTPNALADLLGEAEVVWVLEDFHKLPLGERALLADVMKAFMDAAADYPRLRIIAIGATDTARQIVSLNAEMADRVSEIPVPGMSRAELAQIVAKGCAALNVTMDEGALEKVLVCSDESASACHRLCLNMCRAAGVERVVCGEAVVLTTEHYNKALKRVVSGRDDSLKERFDKATSVQRKRVYENGRLIVEALVRLGGRGTHNEILTEVRKVEPGYPAGNVTQYTKKLQDEGHGAVLKHDPASRVYSFTDELVREYAFSHFDNT